MLPIRRDHPGYCTAEVGNPGRTYELPCTAFINAREGGTDSYQWALNDSDQRKAQRCAATYLRVLLPTHNTGVTATVNTNTTLHYTACCSGGTQKSGNTTERLLKLPQKSRARYEDCHMNI